MLELTNVTAIIGKIVLVAGGFGIAALLLFLAANEARKWAWALWDQLTLIYQLRALNYWLGEMAKHGADVLKQEHDRRLAEKQFAEARSRLVQPHDPGPGSQ
jgi:hypothetical protein